MKKILLFTLALVAMISTTASAKARKAAKPDTLQYQTVMIYPDGNFPQVNGHENDTPMIQPKWTARPFMRIYPAENNLPVDPAVKRDSLAPVIVCLPGGGYSHLAMEHEGYAWAPHFNAKGFAFVVLNYRMPYGNDTIPQSDVYEGIRYLRSHAQELGIDPQRLVIMGHSAGGHLAATVATHAPEECRPNYQILFYPVVSVDEAITHRGTRQGIVGSDPKYDMVVKYSNEQQVDAQTPPCIMLLADDDKAVPSENSIRYYRALKAAGVPATLHIYPNGGHGFGSRPTYRYHDAVLKNLFDWLAYMELIKY